MNFNLNVSEVNSETIETSIIDDVTKSKVSGLMTINDGDELVRVCIVTKETIYLLRSSCPKSVKLLSDILYTPRLNIYTVRGELDHYFLKKYMGINHMGKCLDLTTCHVQFEIRQHLINVRRFYSRNTPCTLDYVAKTIRPKRLNYGQLIARYLHLEVDPNFSPDELRTIKSSPGLTVDSRLALVRCVGPLQELAAKMRQAFLKEMNRATSNQASMCLANDSLRELYDRKETNKFYQLCFDLESLPTESLNDL